MSKEASQLLLDIKRRIFKPVYFLCGEEYYIDLISEALEKSVLDESEKEFNQTVVYGKDSDLGTILSLAKEFPMMSEYKVVIVKEAQNIKELNKNAGDDNDDSSATSSKNINVSSSFIHYIQHPQPTSILVFCFKHKAPDKRGSLIKALQKNAVFAEFKALYENQLPEWITNYVKEKKYNINPKAAFLTAEFLGNNLSKIANEIDKLCINLNEGAEITAELVQDNIGISKDYNIFELQDALAKKDVVKANRIINYFADNEKEHPMVMTLSSLYGYFTKILRYHFLTDKSKFSAAQALGVNPFFVDGYARAAANYNTGKLKFIFACLKEYDLKSKGINNMSVSGGELLKELVFKILH